MILRLPRCACLSIAFLSLVFFSKLEAQSQATVKKSATTFNVQIVVQKKHGNRYFGCVNTVTKDTIIPIEYKYLSPFTEGGVACGKKEYEFNFVLIDTVGRVRHDFGLHYNVIPISKGYVSRRDDTLKIHDVHGGVLQRITNVCKATLSSFSDQVRVVDDSLRERTYYHTGKRCLNPDFGPDIDYDDIFDFFIHQKPLPNGHEFVAFFKDNVKTSIMVSPGWRKGMNYLVEFGDYIYLYTIVGKRLEVSPLRWKVDASKKNIDGVYTDHIRSLDSRLRLVSSNLRIEDDSVFINTTITQTVNYKLKPILHEIAIKQPVLTLSHPAIPVPETYLRGFGDREYYFNFSGSMLGVQGLEGNVVLPSHYEDIYVYGKSPLTFLTRKKNKKYYIVDEHGGEQLLTKDMVLKQLSGIGPEILNGPDSIIIFPGYNNSQYSSFFIEDGMLLPPLDSRNTPETKKWPTNWGNIGVVHDVKKITTIVVDFDAKKIVREYPYIVTPLEKYGTEYLLARGEHGNGVITPSGEVIVPLVGADRASGFEVPNGSRMYFRSFLRNKKYRYYSNTGSAMPPSGAYVSNFRYQYDQNYGVLQHDQGYSLYDENLKLINKRSFTSYHSYAQGAIRWMAPKPDLQYSVVGLDRKHGVLDANGKWVIPLTSALMLELITKDSSMIYIKGLNDRTGKIIGLPQKNLLMDGVENVLTYSQLLLSRLVIR